jgi:hypothetical protein
MREHERRDTGAGALLCELRPVFDEPAHALGVLGLDRLDQLPVHLRLLVACVRLLS